MVAIGEYYLVGSLISDAAKNLAILDFSLSINLTLIHGALENVRLNSHLLIERSRNFLSNRMSLMM